MTTTLWIFGIIAGIVLGAWIGYVNGLSHAKDAYILVTKELKDFILKHIAKQDTLSCTRNCKERRTNNGLAKEIGRKLWELEMKKQEVEQANKDAAESAQVNVREGTLYIGQLEDMGYTSEEASEATMRAFSDHVLIAHPNHKPIKLIDGKMEFVGLPEDTECGDDCRLTFGGDNDRLEKD